MSVTFGELAADQGPWLAEAVSCRRRQVSIAMRDGVELVGDLYMPEGDGPWPLIAERTCYGASALAPLGSCYAAHDYLFLAVDVRGRFRSGGVWDPLTHEKQDGADVLAWAAALPECNGCLGTRGASYTGQNQLLAAPFAGPSLKAMVVAVAPADAFENVPFQGGAYDLGDLLWAWQQAGPAGQATREADDTEEDAAERCTPEELALREALTLRPLCDADRRLGLYVPYLREWMHHWRLDDFWKARSWLPDLSSVRIPTLHVSGWWDPNGRGCALAFDALGRSAGGQKLLIGPWEHALDPPAADDLPEWERSLLFRAALRDAFCDELAWFEYHLKGQGALNSPVEIFITGAWRWMEAEDWPPDGATTQRWQLGADGALAREQAAAGERSYRFDPADPTPVSCWHIPREPAPYNTARDIRHDMLVYRSEPLLDPLLIAGEVRALLSAATTARDVDWVVRLADEYPDGRSIWLRDGILRARFRNGFDAPEPVTPGRFERYTVSLWHAGHLFRPGHRVRVEIASAAWGRWDVNPGDGEDLAFSTASVPATQTLAHGGQEGCCLLLPVVGSERAAELLWLS